MIALQKLKEKLASLEVDYTLFEDKKTLSSAREGVREYELDMTDAAPTFIIKVKDIYVAAIIRGDCRIDFKKLALLLLEKNIKLASEDEVLKITGAKIGTVSLVNSALDTWIDKKILDRGYVYGGCGVENYTLKIKTQDLSRVTNAKIGDF